MSVVEDFCTFLWEKDSGFAVIATLGAQRQPTRQKFFRWPEQAADLYAYVARVTGEDVYTSPSLFSASRAAKPLAKVLRVVHSDADGFNIAEARLEPSLIVHTSPSKTHLYWLLTDTTDPNTAEALAHAVSDTHDKSLTGMDNGWARNKLLRVPGTTNTKYETPYTVTAEMTGIPYTAAEFAAAYPPVESARVELKAQGTLPSYAEALSAIRPSPELMNLLSKDFVKGSAGSEALYRLWNELFRAGASDEQAFVVARQSDLNKWRRDGKANADDLLWEDLQRARAKEVLGTHTINPADFTADAVEATVAPVERPAYVDFLTDTEKDQLPSTFVDDYMAWAGSKTDAAREYHVAAAFTILSTVFSDYGHAVPKFGRLPLNLWFMVLGETTRSRKSTTRGQMLSVLKALADDEVYRYDLGSDFTPEGLDNALLERSNRSGLLHRDEIQDFLKELDSKAYLAGTKGKLTELYDGHVSGKLRATGDVKRKQSVNVSLVLFAMGIRKHVADYLTVGDFQSGFLTRFIYVEADAPPRTADSDWLAQADPSEVEQGDAVFEGLVERLRTAREHWNSFIEVAAPTRPVPCREDAWRRLNKFITDILDAAEGHQRHDVIEASAQRLSLSILKAATLLAMTDCCDEVAMPHMLAAINYCSTWFVHMVNMANRISESAWERRLDAVQEFVASKGGIAPWEMVYKHFKELKSREFMDIVQALSDAGIVALQMDDKKRKWIQIVGAA